MTRKHIGLLICGLLLVSPTLVWAQAQSVDSPDATTCTNPSPPPATLPANVPNNAGAGKVMNVRVFPSNARKIDTGDVGGIAATACDDGPLVAKKAVDKVCLSARLDKNPNNGIADYTCTGFVVPPGVACNNTPGTDCCSSDYSDAVTILMQCVPESGIGGFSLNRDANTARFTITPIPATRINAVNQDTNAGNQFGPDLLPQYLTRVNPPPPGAASALVKYTVYHTQVTTPPTPSPINFTVDTIGKSDLQTHQDIATGFQSLGLGLVALVQCGTNDARLHSAASEKFEGGCFVRIPNAKGQQVTRILVDGDPGQDIVSEHNVPGASVPTLSPWGIGILGVLLLIGAWWLLRRRHLRVPA